ncbi:MAG: hypothetical protein MUO57_01095 [Anaerolineales bacterium]|nr:hypothetical protein [Anaerolineales bacterium]
MNRDSQLTLPPAPNLIGAIRSGFDAITNHIWLILFPIILDLFLWIGPRIKLTSLINNTSEELFRVSASQDPSLVELLGPMQEIWAEFAEQFNMLVLLRSYPVGITSLVVAKSAATSPVADLVGSWEIGSLWGVLLAFVVISLIGIAGGTLFFLVVAQAAVIGDISWKQAFSEWLWSSLQMFFLAILWTVIFLVITIPGSFLLSLVILSGVSYGQCALLVFAGAVFWLILPLVFSPHGIVLNQNSFFESVKISANLARKTLPSTVLFVLAVFLLSKGLDILWSYPKPTSWFLLVGILGHALVTTGLLAASFVYYRDALRWMEEMVKVRDLKTV